MQHDPDRKFGTTESNASEFPSAAYAKLGAFHGLETRFLTGWLRPSRWGEITGDDQRMIDLMTGHWTQFARTGDPSGAALPPWPKYDAKTDQVQELGHEVKQRPIPHGDLFPVFERSLNRRLALPGQDQTGAAQTK